MRHRDLLVGLTVVSALASVAGGAALLVGLSAPHQPGDARVLAPAREEEPVPPPSAATELPAPPAPFVARPPPATPAGETADRVAALRDALTWADDAARIDAIESAVSAHAVETLPVLEAVELAKDPEAAPTIIHAVAMLGRDTRGSEQAGAAEKLGAWLADESQRQGADARGNVSVLVDALGDLGGRDAVGALSAALDQDALPLHVQTLAVQRLAGLNDADARPAIARYAARVATLPPTDGIDESLREEALAVAANAETP